MHTNNCGTRHNVRGAYKNDEQHVAEQTEGRVTLVPMTRLEKVTFMANLEECISLGQKR